MDNSAPRWSATPALTGRQRQRQLTNGLSRILSSETTLIAVLILVGLLAQGLNMFNFPAFTFKDDEGIYAYQAWAVLRLGQLSPYTYFYDHAPVGWIMYAVWMGLTGGPHTFGGAIDSGRVFMLVLHVAMVPLLYQICRKLGCGVAAAGLATLLFSISPLAIFYQRLVLLDTIMLFWVLLSIHFLLDGWGRLSRVALSGLCFGLALLTKETAVFLVPVMILLVFQQRWKHQGRFAVSGWLVLMAMVASFYPLYAGLKGELLPAGEALKFIIFNSQDDKGHVSLVDALRWQATRGGGGMFNLNNLFWQLIRTEWFPRDPVLFGGGAIASIVNVVRGLRNRRALIAGLTGVLSLFYLGRGGVVFDYYILFAIPFLCLNLAILVSPLLKLVPRQVQPGLAGLAVAGLMVGYWQSGYLLPLYQGRDGDAGREAITWIKEHVPANSLIITRDDLWTDLREEGLGGPAFPGIHSHWKVAADPAIRDGVFKNDWHKVDYLIMSPGLEAAFKDTGDQVALDALHNAHFVKRWQAGSSEVELWKVDKSGPTEQMVLSNASKYLKNHFEKDGSWPDPTGTVSSEAQSYALLRSVWSDDREGFNRSWEWTKAHLLDKDGLSAWQWRGGQIVDSHTAAGADTDIALALLMAGKRWNAPALQEAGTAMAKAIWQREVAKVNGKYYLAAGDWATDSQTITLNPSYFAPYAYRIFREVDPAHDWAGLIDTSYQVLFDVSSIGFGSEQSAGLPADWVGLNTRNGELVRIEFNGVDQTTYSYDAPRAYWRVALDQAWSKDGRATTYLNQAGFLKDEVNRKGFVSSVYSHDGRVLQVTPELVGTAGAVAALQTLDPAAMQRLYAEQLVGAGRRDEADGGLYWGSPDDLYTQEWGWFATALYANSLPDLWHAK